jgi:hypothetical protein
MTHRNLALLLSALAASPFSVLAAQDVCGTQSSKPAPAPSVMQPSAAPQKPEIRTAMGINPYPGSGTTLAIPDVTDWQPRGRAPVGTELIVQGRNLVPGQLVAQFGTTQLPTTTQSSSEIRFRLPAQITAGALVVFHKNGQTRTLEPTYQLFVPAAVAITRVVPASFSAGDAVTVCGTNLFEAQLLDNYKEGMDANVTPTKGGSFVDIGDVYADGYHVQVLNPTVSTAGDRITFLIGATFKSGVQTGGASYLFPTTASGYGFKTPASASGQLRISLKTGKTADRIIGPPVTWTPGGPKIARVYGRYFGSNDPFIILPSQNSQNNMLPQFYVEGANLSNATWKVGATTVSASTAGKTGGPDDGTFAIVGVPLNITNGPLCGTSNGKSGCSAPIQFFGAPVIGQAPAMPLPMKTNITITGTNLLPPSGITGLKYTLVVNGLPEASTVASLPSSNTDVFCNRVVTIIEHTAQRITFRIGDPAKTTPPNCTTTTAPFKQDAAYTINITGQPQGEAGLQNLIRGIPYWLKP